jgi:hypothetical protein
VPDHGRFEVVLLQRSVSSILRFSYGSACGLGLKFRKDDLFALGGVK